jgi:hypothetical protein
VEHYYPNGGHTIMIDASPVSAPVYLEESYKVPLKNSQNILRGGCLPCYVNGIVRPWKVKKNVIPAIVLIIS